MAGAEVQANAIWTALHGLPLRSVPPWVDLLDSGRCSAMLRSARPLAAAAGRRWAP